MTPIHGGRVHGKTFKYVGLTQCPDPVSSSGNGTNTRFSLTVGKGHLHCPSSMDGKTESESTKKVLSKFFWHQTPDLLALLPASKHHMSGAQPYLLMLLYAGGTEFLPTINPSPAQSDTPKNKSVPILWDCDLRNPLANVGQCEQSSSKDHLQLKVNTFPYLLSLIHEKIWCSVFSILQTQI